MADLAAIKKSLKAAYDKIYGEKIDAENNSYNTQESNTRNTYNTEINQAKQVLAKIPEQYQGTRESAYLVNQKANNALPEQMYNLGNSADSGLAANANTANNTAMRKTVSAANKSQDTDIQNQQNSINTMNTNLASALATIQANRTSTVNSLRSAEEEALTSAAEKQYQAEVAAEAKRYAAEQAAAAKVRAAQIAAQQKAQENAQKQAQAAAKASESRVNAWVKNIESHYIKNGKYTVSMAQVQQAIASSGLNANEQKELANKLPTYNGSQPNTVRKMVNAVQYAPSVQQSVKNSFYSHIF